MDRWYHRSAIVVWHRNHHFDIIASSGAIDSIPLFCAMTAKLAKTAKKRLEEIRGNCICFARAILAHWPRRNRPTGDAYLTKKEESPYDEFIEQLHVLSDQDTIAICLSTLAEKDQTLRLKSFVPAACREFGWNAFAQELKQLLLSCPNQYDPDEIPFRDAEWLSAICCDTTADAEKSALADELCALAVERFCKPKPPRPAYYSPHFRRGVSVSEASLPLLLKALAAIGRDDDLARVIHFVQESPNDFRLDECQVPCLKALIPWSHKRLGLVQPQLTSWLISVRNQLESATARQPARPTDWARPADVDCTCQDCTRLKAFLADPANEVGRIPAREDRRRHLIGMIDRHRCDVKHALERKGSPYSLVLTKTTGSFECAVQQYEANRKLLEILPIAE